MVTEQDFQQAVARSKELTKRPGNDELLLLYALFKQATEGDVHGDKPGGFDFKGMAKWNAWEEQKGKSQEAARSEYVALMNQLYEKYA
jgi:diazepam-binding inhibitor (GABA receptor modulator, acyl-CoA-binding protein)